MPDTCQVRPLCTITASKLNRAASVCVPIPPARTCPNSTGDSRFPGSVFGFFDRKLCSVLSTYRVHICRGEVIWDKLKLSHQATPWVSHGSAGDKNPPGVPGQYASWTSRRQNNCHSYACSAQTKIIQTLLLISKFV